MNVAMDYTEKAREMLALLDVTTDGELRLRLVRSYLGTAFVEGGIKAIDMVRDEVGV